MYSRGATQIDGIAAQLVSLTRKTALATYFTDAGSKASSS
jgi:hypothetical protein